MINDKSITIDKWKHLAYCLDPKGLSTIMDEFHSKNEHLLHPEVLTLLSSNKVRLESIKLDLEGNDKSIKDVSKIMTTWSSSSLNSKIKRKIKTPDGKVRNPTTGRFIKADGKLAKDLGLKK